MKKFLCLLLLSLAATAEGPNYEISARISGLNGTAEEAHPRVVTPRDKQAIIHVSAHAPKGEPWKDGYWLSLKPGQRQDDWLELDCQLEIREQDGSSKVNFHTMVPLGKDYVFSFGPESGSRYELQLKAEPAP